MSDSVRPHRRQPTQLPSPWDSPGKNTGVGCHFLLQCMKVKSESEVAQLCLTLSDPMDCSLPGPPINGIFQARVLEWGAIAFSLVIARVIQLRSEKISWKDLNLLKFSKFICDLTYDLCWRIFHLCFRRMNIVLLLDGMFCICL